MAADSASSIDLTVVTEPEAQSGSDNMRIDEELLNVAASNEVNTLRFYQWSEPTISLGYFQKDVRAPEGLEQLPVVQRLSGGGAILHHHELTYSLSLGRSHPCVLDPTGIYRVVHAAIIECLGELGFECSLRGEAASDPTNKSFLCFSRSDPNDIVHRAHKVVGSAQRRRRGAVLQHGSILLRTSEFAPEIPGIVDLGGVPATALELAERLEKLIPRHLAVPLQ
ncbi:MAG: biotin/lipoate A/B protein ligase family protein [Planctomycetaceae bacterium]